MSGLQAIQGSPMWARVFPFVVVLGLTVIGGELGGVWTFWMYVAKTALGAWALWFVASVVKELQWRLSWEAVAVGVLVFLFWVGLDGLYPALPGRASEGEVGWAPLAVFEGSPELAWFFIIVRILGSTLIVPPIEEIFYRSFLYRYLADPKFETVPLNKFHAFAFVATCVAFGLAHFEWLAGILCGVCYQGLVLKKGRLGDAVTAHAITNFLLGVYIVWKGAYVFW